MELLNNRELAILIWLGLFAAWALSKAAVRKSLIAVCQAIFKRQILLPILLQAIYIAFAVYAFSAIGLWDVSQLKSTILWTVLVGIASMFRIARSDENPTLVRTWIEDNLKIIVVVEFIATFYTSHIVVELIMVPLLALIGGMLAMAESRKEYQPVVNFLNGLLSLLGVALIGYALYRIFSEFLEFASLQTAQDIYTPPLLSFVLIPFLFALYIFVCYENAFLRLQFAIPDARLRAYARFKAILAFRHRVELLRRWSRNIGVSRPSDRDSVHRSIREVLAAWNRERNPPIVAPTEGWSPYAAVGFLREEGLVTDDYHRSFDEWFANSPYQEIGDGFPKDNVAYYVEGDEHAATQLKLVLNINNPTDPTASEERFRELAITLSKKALGDDAIEKDVGSLLSQDHATLQIGQKEVRLSREDWSGGIRGGYERKFVIEHVFSTLSP